MDTIKELRKQEQESRARLDDLTKRVEDLSKKDKLNQYAPLTTFAAQLNATPVPYYDSELRKTLSDDARASEMIYKYLAKKGIYTADAVGRANFTADLRGNKSGDEIVGYANKTYARFSQGWKQFFIVDFYRGLRPRRTAEDVFVVGGLAGLVLSAGLMIGSWLMSEPSNQLSWSPHAYEQYVADVKSYTTFKSVLKYLALIAGVASVASGATSAALRAGDSYLDLKSDYFASFLKNDSLRKS